MRRNGILRQVVGDLSFSNSTPFAKLLDWCTQSKSLRDCQSIHARIIKSPFASELFMQNRLIDVYAKCACIDDARKLFDKMSQKNTFTYNSIINALTKSGFLDEASELFLSIPEPDQCSWNSMISGFAQHGQFEEAVECFVKMHEEDFVLNEYSFGSVLSACSGLEEMGMGLQVHGLLSKSPYFEDVYMGSALVDMYSKCGNVEYARRVFDEMGERNVVTWNSLITCYEQNGPTNEALEIFVRMMDSGLEPDEVTLASVVSACATLTAIREGMQIHARVVRIDEYSDDLILGNALVDMYAKCGRINEARWIFDKMPVRNVVSETSMVSGYAKGASLKAAESLFVKMMDRNIVASNALMAGYIENGENEEAINLFCSLKRDSVWPSHYTFANLLNACSNLADLKFGRQVHTHVLKHGFRFQAGPESNIFVGNALIDMYMKCGSVEEGWWVFKNMLERDYVSWNAIIVGYAQNGYGVEAIENFRKMLESGQEPDHITMIGVLCACSHAGLVEEGRQYFQSMIKQHGLVPLKDHYACMVDLLGRAGCLDEAKMLIETMPVQPDNAVWASLLAACRVHHNIEMGKYVAERILEIDPTNSGPYVLLSNLYAELGKWRDVTGVRKLMRQRGVIKQPGCSWVEVQSQIHVFMVKDRRHFQRKEIYMLLQGLTKQMKLAGYVPACDDMEVEEQADSQSTFRYPPETQAVALVR
ncbi:Pentatricopeptide repeat-containing protein At2g13600 [Ancistrocladus abbreviatus]